MNQSSSMILALGLGFIIVIVFTFLPNKVSPFQSQGGKSNFGLAVGMLLFGLWPSLHDSDVMNSSGVAIPAIPFFFTAFAMASFFLFLAIRAEKKSSKQ